MPHGSHIENYLAILHDMGLVSRTGTARSRFENIFAGTDLEGKRMLDIGGGRGIYSFYAAAAGARSVVCLEPEAAGSAAGVTKDFERIRSELRVAPVVLDPRTVQEYESPEPFDVVLMYASVNHIDEDACVRLPGDAKARDAYKREFSRIASLLVPGGRLLVSDCSNRNFFALLGAKSPVCPFVEWHKHQPPRVWVRLLEESGFRSPRVRWEPLFVLGAAGRALTANAAAAYFLKSIFHLTVEKA
jgi:SAM-dependent methyltransferase